MSYEVKTSELSVKTLSSKQQGGCDNCGKPIALVNAYKWGDEMVVVRLCSNCLARYDVSVAVQGHNNHRHFVRLTLK